MENLGAVGDDATQPANEGDLMNILTDPFQLFITIWRRTMQLMVKLVIALIKFKYRSFKKIVRPADN